MMPIIFQPVLVEVAAAHLAVGVLVVEQMQIMAVQTLQELLVKVMLAELVQVHGIQVAAAVLAV
jgi:hypothetical protein